MFRFLQDHKFVIKKNNWWQDTGTEYEKYNTYWYHADHLGSAQLVSNWKGEEYERIEYTPYGEIWVEKVKNGHESINYRFTGKEMDSETGLYYFGARYLDPKYSRWLSTDPALRDYIPQAPVNDEARKNNQNLPGQGGLFNHIKSNLYHYAGNNPVRYVDPDGRETTVLIIHANSGWEKLANGSHVAVHFSDPGTDSYGEFIPASLYDPSGSYDGGINAVRPSSGVFSERDSSSLNKYIDSVLNRKNGEYVIAYSIETTPEQEAKMVEDAMKKGDGFGFNCADNVSSVMEEIGFSHSLTPGGLENQLKKSEKVINIKVFKNEEE